MTRGPMRRRHDSMARATSYSGSRGYCFNMQKRTLWILYRVKWSYPKWIRCLPSIRRHSICLSLSLSVSGWQDFARDGISNGGTLHLTRSPRKKCWKFGISEGHKRHCVTAARKYYRANRFQMAIGWSAAKEECAKFRSKDMENYWK